MAPMVAPASEAAWFASRVRAHGLRTAGVMVEVPAAALCARQILEVADFASIGTNDLAQYTMAADRMAGPLAALNDPWQPGAAPARAGHRRGRRGDREVGGRLRRGGVGPACSPWCWSGSV